jgi:cation diffusion facilitator family transporter
MRAKQPSDGPASSPRDEADPSASRFAESAARGVRATVRGILASSVLGVVKIVAGILGNSYALIADGVESMLDIISSIVVWGGLEIAVQPPNERHPYGYGKAEPLAALVVAAALLTAAVGIAIQSIREIRTPHHMPEPFTLVVLVAVVVTKEMMFRFLRRTGESIGSRALETDAWHHRSDSLTSIAAFLGISVALTFGEGYESADDWAALFASAVILYSGVRFFRSAWREVLDVAPPTERLERIRELAMEVDDVLGVDKCRARRSGLGLFVEIHVIVHADLSVRVGHEIGHRVKDRLIESDLGILDVSVHIEPHEHSPLPS